MGKSSPSAPPPPDPVATANAQTTSNIQTAEANARLNRINEYNPYYSVLYNRTPGATGQPTGAGPTPLSAPPSPSTAGEWNRTAAVGPGGVAQWQHQKTGEMRSQDANPGGGTVPPGSVYGGGSGGGSGGYGEGVPDPSTYTRTIQFTPQQQAIFDSQQQTDLGLSQLAGENIERVRQAQSKPFNYDGIPELMSGQQMDAERRRVEGALYDRLNPLLDRDKAMLEQRLADQGIAIGSQAYSSAMGDEARARNDARLAVTERGLQETQGLFGLGLGRRQQGIQERAYERSYPINEVATLLGTAGPVQTPQFGQAPQVGVQGTDVTGPIYANYQGAQNIFAQKTGARNAQAGANAGVIGAGLTAAAIFF